jgi:predicted PurR-regulated permease PerM
MDVPISPGPDPASAPARYNRAIGILGTASVLALLYFARDVLVPITLAVFLSLLIAPLVRILRRIRLGRVISVLAAVLLLTVAFATFAAVIGVQVVRMRASLPQYEETIRQKLQTVNEMTVGRMKALTSEAAHIIDRHPANGADTIQQGLLEQPDTTEASNPIPVEVHQPPSNPLQLVESVLASVWAPIEVTGVTLVVLVFVLLEHEALRDRFVRLAGVTDIRLTTFAINDAGERLSRFFVSSQFAVNFGFGAVIWLGLATLGLPHALVWAALAAVLRFVPYVGVWIAACLSVVLAAAVDPGWSLAIKTFGLFVLVELVAGQLVEPQLYGHTTGLSPLSVVIAAIFWSWLWGPIGLIVSTPLTLCLLVAGRHIKALSILDILLGDTQSLTMPQTFYQRALSADSDEIIARAREFLKRNTVAAYCDLVLIPALQLAWVDHQGGAISRAQEAKVRKAVVTVVVELSHETRALWPWKRRNSVPDGQGIGRQLRLEREERFGPWQGPLDVPPGSVMLGVGLGSLVDDLAAEILVRLLRDQKSDARHFSLEDLQGPVPPEAKPASILAVYLVSAFPSEERQRVPQMVEEIRRRFPRACVVTVFLPGMLWQPGSAAGSVNTADRSTTSLGEALHIGQELKPMRPPN